MFFVKFPNGYCYSYKSTTIICSIWTYVSDNSSVVVQWHYSIIERLNTETSKFYLQEINSIVIEVTMDERYRKVSSITASDIAPPILQRRRLSAPETIMRKHMLAQQRSSSQESDRSQGTRSCSFPDAGSDPSLARKRDDIRRSTLIRQFKDGSRSVLQFPRTYSEWQYTFGRGKSVLGHGTPEHLRTSRKSVVETPIRRTGDSNSPRRKVSVYSYGPESVHKEVTTSNPDLSVQYRFLLKEDGIEGAAAAPPAKTNLNVITNVNLSQSTLNLIFNQVMHDVFATPQTTNINQEVNTVNVKKLSGVEVGSPYKNRESSLVPRLSALPRSTSMEVNTSPNESFDRDDHDSDSVSLADSLDEPTDARVQRARQRGDLTLLPDNSEAPKPNTNRLPSTPEDIQTERILETNYSKTDERDAKWNVIPTGMVSYLYDGKDAYHYLEPYRNTVTNVVMSRDQTMQSHVEINSDKDRCRNEYFDTSRNKDRDGSRSEACGSYNYEACDTTIEGRNTYRNKARDTYRRNGADTSKNEGDTTKTEIWDTYRNRDTNNETSETCNIDAPSNDGNQLQMKNPEMIPRNESYWISGLNTNEQEARMGCGINDLNKKSDDTNYEHAYHNLDPRLGVRVDRGLNVGMGTNVNSINPATGTVEETSRARRPEVFYIPIRQEECEEVPEPSEDSSATCVSTLLPVRLRQRLAKRQSQLEAKRRDSQLRVIDVENGNYFEKRKKGHVLPAIHSKGRGRRNPTGKDDDNKVELLEIVEIIEPPRVVRVVPKAKSRIPVPVNQNQRLPRIRSKPTYLDFQPRRDPKLDQLIANILIDTLNRDEGDSSNNNLAYPKPEAEENNNPMIERAAEMLTRHVLENNESRNSEATLPKGWITFYMMQQKNNSPQSTSDEGRKEGLEQRCLDSRVDLESDLESEGSARQAERVNREWAVRSERSERSDRTKRADRHGQTGRGWRVTVSGDDAPGTDRRMDVVMRLRFPEIPSHQKRRRGTNRTRTGFTYEDACDKRPSELAKSKQYLKNCDATTGRGCRKPHTRSKYEPRPNKASTQRTLMTHPCKRFEEFMVPIESNREFDEILRKLPNVLRVNGNAVARKRRLPKMSPQDFQDMLSRLGKH